MEILGACADSVNFSVAIEGWGHGGQGTGEPAEGFEQRGHRVDLGESQVGRKAQVCFGIRRPCLGREVPRGGCGVVYQGKGIAGRANSMCKCPGALGCMTQPGN